MYETHPVLDQFPAIGKTEYSKLKRDISKNGQRRPIALYEGLIWDGRARLQACAELGLQPKLRILKPKDQPVAYLLLRHDRYGEPSTPQRRAALEILWRIIHEDWITAFKHRRAEWLRVARNEFRAIVPRTVQRCEVCNHHAEFVHAHHSLPLAVQFDLGIDQPVHEFNWLCPTHHRHVHMMISVYITNTRSGGFLDRIPDHTLENWNGVERIFKKSFELFEGFGGMHQNGLGWDRDYQ